MSKKNRHATAKAAAPNGAAFGANNNTPDEHLATDPKRFDVRKWASGAGIVVKAIEVCGKPHLIGRIEELKAMLDRPDVDATLDDRPYADTPGSMARAEIAKALEQARDEALDSIVVWKIRGLRNGEAEEVRAAVSDDAYAAFVNRNNDEFVLGDELTEYEYRLFAKQVVSIAGQPASLTWEDLRFIHVGDGVESHGLGAYFNRTIVRTANQTAAGVGVDVPFSSTSYSLTRDS